MIFLGHSIQKSHFNSKTITLTIQYDDYLLLKRFFAYSIFFHYKNLPFKI